MKQKVLLEKVTGGDQIRTDTVTGYLMSDVVVGNTMSIIADSVDPSADVRFIHTTPIVSVVELSKDCKLFKTLNSTYKITFLKE